MSYPGVKSVARTRAHKAAAGPIRECSTSQDAPYLNPVNPILGPSHPSFQPKKPLATSFSPCRLQQSVHPAVGAAVHCNIANPIQPTETGCSAQLQLTQDSPFFLLPLHLHHTLSQGAVYRSFLLCPPPVCHARALS